MRLTKLLIPLLSLSFLASCGGPADEELVIIEIPEEEEISKGSVGGDLIDMSLGYYLEPNAKYLCSFTPSSSSTSMRVVSSREASVKIEMITENIFNVVTVKPGDSLLTIYDANNIIKFNKVIHVRKAYTPNEMVKALYDNDIYTSTGIYGSYRFSLNKYDTQTATGEGSISGTDKDTAENSKFVFNISYDSIAEGDLFEGHFYIFNVEMDVDQSTLDYDISYLYISKCADVFMAYDYNGDLFEIFSLRK